MSDVQEKQDMLEGAEFLFLAAIGVDLAGRVLLAFSHAERYNTMTGNVMKIEFVFENDGLSGRVMEIKGIKIINSVRFKNSTDLVTATSEILDKYAEPKIQ